MAKLAPLMVSQGGIPFNKEHLDAKDREIATRDARIEELTRERDEWQRRAERCENAYSDIEIKAEISARKQAEAKVEELTRDLAERPDWKTVDITYEKWMSRAEAAEQQVAVLREALERSRIAIDDWMNLYAPEHCNETRVAEARARTNENGTLWYIANVQEQNCAALKGGK